MANKHGTGKHKAVTVGHTVRYPTTSPAVGAHTGGHKVKYPTTNPAIGATKNNPVTKLASAGPEAIKHILIEPVIGDFKKNRGKVVIGLTAGVILLGSGLHLVNNASGGGALKLAGAAISPELEGLAVAKRGLGQGMTRKLHAREPVAPVRAAMARANP